MHSDYLLSETPTHTAGPFAPSPCAASGRRASPQFSCRAYVLLSRNLRKVSLLLNALDGSGKNVDYYALDLSEQELRRTLAQLPQYKSVRCHGLLGTYD